MMDIRRGQFWIKYRVSNTNLKAKVDGIILNDKLGLAAFHEDEYTVTHLATGCRVTKPFNTLGQAFEFAERIIDLTDWSLLNVSDQANLSDRVREIRNETIYNAVE